MQRPGEDDDYEELLVGNGSAEGAGDNEEEDDDGELAPEDVHDEDDEEGQQEDGDEGEEENGEDGGAKDRGPSVPSGPDIAARVFKSHTDSVYCIDISSSSRRLAVTGCGDDTAILWDLDTCEVKHTLRGHTDTVVAAKFSFDGKYVATGGYDGLVLVWDAATGEQVHRLEGVSGEIEWLDWHARGNVLLAGGSDGTAWLWSIDSATSFTCMQVFAGHEGNVSCGGFTPSGKSVLTGSADATVKAWNPKTGAATASFAPGHGWCEGPITSVCMQTDHPVLSATSQDGSVRLANVATGKILKSFYHPGSGATEDETTSVESAAFSTSNPWLASGATDGSVRIWDLNTGHARASLDADAGVIKVDWVTGMPHLLATSTINGAVKIWDSRNGSLVQSLTGHTGMILDFTSITGKEGEIVTCGDDSTVRIFNLQWAGGMAVVGAGSG